MARPQHKKPAARSPVIQTRRIFLPPGRDEGVVFLVDRLWPRGVKKESLQMTRWLKEAAPSDGLRRWFGHDPGKWTEFRRRYHKELAQRPEALRVLLEAASRGPVTLLFAARDEEHNNAVALAEYLAAHLRSSGIR